MPRSGSKKKKATQYNRVTNEMAQLVQARLGQMGDQDVNITERDVRVMRSMMIDHIGLMTALIIKHRQKQLGQQVILKWDILEAAPQDAATQTDKDTECVRSVEHKHTETDRVGETHRICDTRPAKPLDGSVESDVQVPHEAHDAYDDRLAAMYDKCGQIATKELQQELQIPIDEISPKQLKERTVLIFRSHKRKLKRKEKEKAQKSVVRQCHGPSAE